MVVTLAWANRIMSGRNPRLLCLCVFFPFILDIKFVGRTSRGHTGGRSHRTSHPPSFCGACLDLSRGKDSAFPFPRRPWSRILGLLCIRKAYTKMGQIRFFRVFSILWVREWSRFVWPNPFELFVTGLQTDLVPKSVCSSDTNLQTDFARGATITTFGQ